MTVKRKPVVFACAGCSSVAKLSWEVAKELDRRGVAEMSCLAGVGAQKRRFLRLLEGRPIWVVDGCPIACGLGIMGLVNRKVDWHIRLDTWGCAKHDDYAHSDIHELVDRLLDAAAESDRLTETAGGVSAAPNPLRPWRHRAPACADDAC